MPNNKGFTLVELMISLAMTGIIIAAVYSVYTLQQKTHTAQDQVVEMQQNIRAATMIMEQELRMAGYDPTSDADATFTAATVAGFGFGQDITDTAGTDTDGDGKLDGPNEIIGYGFAAGDANNDGFVDAGGVSALGRSTGFGALQPIAENIQAIEFFYTVEDGTQTTSPVADGFSLSDIRTITISILARTAWQDPKFVNNFVYTTASGDEWGLNGRTAAGAGVPFNDNYRRRLLITTVQCRNMGL